MSASTLELNCFILGDPYGSRGIFEIIIQSTQTVSTLREAISARIDDEVKANRLRLWKTSLFVDPKFDENVGNITLVDNENLSPVK